MGTPEEVRDKKRHPRTETVAGPHYNRRPRCGEHVRTAALARHPPARHSRYIGQIRFESVRSRRTLRHHRTEEHRRHG